MVVSVGELTNADALQGTLGTTVKYLLRIKEGGRGKILGTVLWRIADGSNNVERTIVG